MHNDSRLPSPNIIEMVASVNTETNEIIFHVQSEIEDLALEVLGTAEDIYSEDLFEIPIGNNLVIEYQRNKGWVLCPLNSDCI